MLQAIQLILQEIQLLLRSEAVKELHILKLTRHERSRNQSGLFRDRRDLWHESGIAPCLVNISRIHVFLIHHGDISGNHRTLQRQIRFVNQGCCCLLPIWDFCSVNFSLVFPPNVLS